MSMSSQDSAPYDSGRFRSTVSFYERYRLGYPQRLIDRVTRLMRLPPGAAVLDLGTGTGMLAIGFARAGMAVTAMDPEPAMLAAAEKATLAAQVDAAFARGDSDDLRPGMGSYRLVTIGRAFHWMDRAATLAMLDQIVTPDGGVALFHDAHPDVAENRWFKTLVAVTGRYGRAGAPHVAERKGGHRRYEPFLLASAFTQLDGLSVTIKRPITTDEIVGRAFSMSATAPARLGARAPAFEAELRARLADLSPDGQFVEVAELVAVLARRPVAGEG
jgi:ubiquinone/menaquinone biosynthesis C-methylase UbiE